MDREMQEMQKGFYGTIQTTTTKGIRKENEISKIARGEEMKYNYFVSYSCTGGFGNAETCLRKQIEGIADIELIARSFERDFKVESVVILNYKLLKETNG